MINKLKLTFCDDAGGGNNGMKKSRKGDRVKEPLELHNSFSPKILC